MSKLEINGLPALFYLDKGEGQPVVFVHGALEDYRAWSAQVDAFSHDYRVITYSRRCSYPNEIEGAVEQEDTVENNVEDLAALIKKLGVAPVHAVGHSYGGFIVAYLAFKHPELVRSLVLVEPAITTLFIQNPNNLLQLLLLLFRHPSFAIAAIGLSMRAQSALNAFQQGDSEKAARLFVEEIQARPHAFDQLPDYARKMMIDNAKTLFDLKVVLPAFDRADTRRVLAPTVIVKGGTSQKTLQDVANALSQSMPHCELITIANAGHFSQIEKPEEFNAITLKFLLSQN